MTTEVPEVACSGGGLAARLMKSALSKALNSKREQSHIAQSQASRAQAAEVRAAAPPGIVRNDGIVHCVRVTLQLRSRLVFVAPRCRYRLCLPGNTTSLQSLETVHIRL